MPDLCEDAATRCDDSNECTDDDCDPADGACSNPAVPDNTVCEFAPDVGGVCTAGACEDAMLCADAATRCDDSDECTQNLCDPADGVCSNPAEPDDTVCEFAPGVGGICTAGACEDAMLCADAATRCDDSDECTVDDCDPADGSCFYVQEADGTLCDAGGFPGACDTGACVATCTPTPGLDITLPTMSPTVAVPEYVDVTNGFEITAPVRDVTIGFFGFGANAVASKSALEANALLGDSLVLEFFDMNGVPSTASSVSMVLSSAGTGGNLEVVVDGVTTTIRPAVPGGTVLLSTDAAHRIQISVPVSDSAQLYWESLSYDHECL
jgi:hypothetical protein